MHATELLCPCRPLPGPLSGERGILLNTSQVEGVRSSRQANARQVLGGTAQRGDTDLTPREEDRAHIWQGCLKMAPSLAAAKVSPGLL